MRSPSRLFLRATHGIALKSGFHKYDMFGAVAYLEKTRNASTLFTIAVAASGICP